MYKVNSQAVDLMVKYCLKENKHLVQASGTMLTEIIKLILTRQNSTC